MTAAASLAGLLLLTACTSGGESPDDFAYSGFKNQIDAMAGSANGVFVEADSEAEGNLAYREREGYRHDGAASDEYTYNGLRFFWNPRTR